MHELTINGTVFQFNFGIGFMREINKEVSAPEKKILVVPLYSGPVKVLVTPPCGASSNIALWRAKIKPPVELVVGDLDDNMQRHENQYLNHKYQKMKF